MNKLALMIAINSIYLSLTHAQELDSNIMGIAFSFLPKKDLARCEMVCKSWKEAIGRESEGDQGEGSVWHELYNSTRKNFISNLPNGLIKDNQSNPRYKDSLGHTLFGIYNNRANASLTAYIDSISRSPCLEGFDCFNPHSVVIPPQTYYYHVRQDLSATTHFQGVFFHQYLGGTLMIGEARNTNNHFENALGTQGTIQPNNHGVIRHSYTPHVTETFLHSYGQNLHNQLIIISVDNATNKVEFEVLEN